MTCSATCAASASGSFLKPSAVIVATTGKMRLGRSGPPVAESSSAASYNACTQASTASAAGSGHAAGVELLQRAAGEQEPRADGVEPLLLIRAAGHVVAEDPALAA